MAIIDPEGLFEEKWKMDNFILPTSRIPTICACYVFFSGERCLYAGKAVNLRARMALHQWKFGYINYRRMPETSAPLKILAVALPRIDLAVFEKFLIAYLHPEMNIHFNGNRRRRIV